jgi:hypothetical protein
MNFPANIQSPKREHNPDLHEPASMGDECPCDSCSETPRDYEEHTAND